jgi:hypothetical protein
MKLAKDIYTTKNPKEKSTLTVSPCQILKLWYKLPSQKEEAT